MAQYEAQYEFPHIPLALKFLIINDNLFSRREIRTHRMMPIFRGSKSRP